MRVWAKGLLGLEAAVELLIGHGVWPARADFAAAALTFCRDGVTGAAMAAVDFEAALAARRAASAAWKSTEIIVAPVMPSRPDVRAAAAKSARVSQVPCPISSSTAASRHSRPLAHTRIAAARS